MSFEPGQDTPKFRRDLAILEDQCSKNKYHVKNLHKLSRQFAFHVQGLIDAGEELADCIFNVGNSTNSPLCEGLFSTFLF
jgi:hypothetical protein